MFVGPVMQSETYLIAIFVRNSWLESTGPFVSSVIIPADTDGTDSHFPHHTRSLRVFTFFLLFSFGAVLCFLQFLCSLLHQYWMLCFLTVLLPHCHILSSSGLLVLLILTFSSSPLSYHRTISKMHGIFLIV